MVEYQTTQITNNDLVNTVPAISGNNIVWRADDGNDGEIFFYNGTNITQLTDNDLFDVAPQINEDNIAWYGSSLDPTENEIAFGSIFFYDGSDIIELANADSITTPVVSGNNNIVWSDIVKREIFLYDGDGTIKIGDSIAPILGPNSISGNNVVWTDRNEDENDLEVFLYDGNNVRQITDNDLSETFPLVSGSNIVWTGNIIDGNDLSSAEIFLFDGENTIQLTDNNTVDLALSISGENVVWLGNDGNDEEIFLYDGENTIQLTDNDFDDLDPKAFGDNIVWEADDGNDREIFLYDGITITQLTDNDVDDRNPDISGDNITWESEGDIFLATPQTEDNSEPTSTIELFRFRNTNFDTGTYIFVGEAEKEAIENDDNLNRVFELEGGGEPAFIASSEEGEDLAAFYRFQSTITPSTYIFVGEEERQSINENFSDSFTEEGLAFYVYGADTGLGEQFSRFQNNSNGTYLFAGSNETNAIENDDNFSSIFDNEGVAFGSLG